MNTYNPEVQVVLEELDELHGRLMSLMIEFPQFQHLTKEIRNIANEKDQHNPIHLQLCIASLYVIYGLFDKMLRNKNYENIWKKIRPCYVLTSSLLSAA